MAGEMTRTTAVVIAGMIAEMIAGTIAKVVAETTDMTIIEERGRSDPPRDCGGLRQDLLQPEHAKVWRRIIPTYII